MAVKSLVTAVFLLVSTLALNLTPPHYLGSYSDSPIRWPYGGCVEVTKIYPAPGLQLPPPLNKYSKEWNVTITVVFSRPVTATIRNFKDRTWLRIGRYLGDTQLSKKCARNACLFLKLDGKYFSLTSTTSGPTLRGNVFSDEYQFTFTIPSNLRDYVSELYFALDGGWMYSPVHKFSANADVEYVPYIAVRYLPPGNASRPPERDTNYWVNHPAMCAVRSGLMYRPFIFRRAKIEEQVVTTDRPKLLTELSEVVNISSKERKLRLYYRMKQPGIHAIQFPDIITALDKEANLRISLSAPAIKSLIIRYSSPRLYIPLLTNYIFDYRERAYYDEPKWNDYFFTRKTRSCHGDGSFECNAFTYIREFPHASKNSYYIFTDFMSGGFSRPAEVTQLLNTTGLGILRYHSLDLFDNESFPFVPHPEATWKETRLVSGQLQCLKTASTDYCQRTVSNLVLNPYWKIILIYGKNTGKFLDAFMISDELKKALFKSEGTTVPNFVGMMEYSSTGSAYIKNMSDVIPHLINRFAYNRGYSNRLLTESCHCKVKRNLGKWGRLKTYIEYGNMYRLHVPYSPYHWMIQQTMDVKYRDQHNRQRALKAALISIPEHIKKAVQQYVVLTSMQPATDAGRVRAGRESYPLEKAVFIPQQLRGKVGCGTLRIDENHISSIREDYRQKYGDSYFVELCDRPPDDCTGLPFDSLERFPLIPPFNVPDLTGPIDPGVLFNRRALYYRDNAVNDLFILNSPNSYYTGVVEISGGVEIKEPEFVETSCDNLWEFSPDRYEITRGHLTATLANKGEGGASIVLTVRCTPGLGMHLGRIKLWVDPHQTKNATFLLGGYLREAVEKKTGGYKCEMSISIDVTRFSSIVGKNLPLCKIFIPTFSGSFVNPCKSYLDHDVLYYQLPREFAHDFSLKTFLSSNIGREFELLKLISVKLVRYHMIHLSCKNDDVLVLTEDQLISGSTVINADTVGKGISLVYSIDRLLQRRIYIFMKKQQYVGYNDDKESETQTKCLLTLLSSPYIACGLSSRKYLVITKADIPEAMALESREAMRKSPRVERSIWNKWISEREEVISAVLACTVTSIILMVLVITGNSALFIYNKLSSSERELQQIREKLQAEKREHKTRWNNPQMYLKKGVLGPHYVLYKFKATDSLDTSNLKVLKIAGSLRYKAKEIQVIFGHVKKVVIKKTKQGIVPDQVWLQASTGMYLLKQKYVSKEYEEEFISFLKRHAGKDTEITS